MHGPHLGHDTRRTARGGEPASADVRPHADARPSTDARPNNGHPQAAHSQAARRGGRRSALLDRPFGRGDITVVRHEVADRLRVVGVPDDRLQGFVLAVNEVITNVVLHAGGSGRLVLRVADGSAYCTVIDSGPGIPDHLRAAPEVPATSEVGGRGIWLAYQLCDEVTIESQGEGTTIELRIRVSLSEVSASGEGQVNRAAAAG